MTKQIKTAQAWLVWTPRGNVYKTYAHTSGSGPASTVVIVHGLTEAEVHEAAELLAKSREVCEWGTVLYKGRTGYWTLCKEWERVCGSAVDALPTSCVCGRRVVVKEG